MTEERYTLAAQLGQNLYRQGAKVTTAESCTGGGIAHAITAVPGSSRWFDYGFVTYSNEAKQRLLNVSAEILQTHGAVSSEVVSAMAIGAAYASSADFAVAVSGIAGPGGGSAEKPVGTVWFAWYSPAGLTNECHLFTGDRESVRDQAVRVALRGLLYRTSTV
jgi:nicotinamide-nucleotide amidase